MLSFQAVGNTWQSAHWPGVLLLAGPSPGFSSRGGKKTGGAKNQKGGLHF